MTACNLDAERAALGAILLGGESSLREALAQGLRPEDFFWEDNQAVFGAMIGMYEDRRHVDPLTLGSFMRDRAMVDELAAAPFSVSHLEEYARIVLDCAYLRRMRKIAHRIIKATEAADVAELKVLVGQAVALLPKDGPRAVERKAA